MTVRVAKICEKQRQHWSPVDAAVEKHRKFR